MKILKIAMVLVMVTIIAGCSATPTRRAFKEGWRDAAVTSRVKWKLGRDKAVQAHNINVDTWRGVVTLTGRATSDGEKTRAEQVAVGVKNVKQVRNFLDVAGAGSVPTRGVKKNVPFSKPAGKFAKTTDITVPALDAGKTGTASVAAAAAAPKISETDIKDNDGVSKQIGKELATVDEDAVTEKVAPTAAPTNDVTSSSSTVANS